MWCAMWYVLYTERDTIFCTVRLIRCIIMCYSFARGDYMVTRFVSFVNTPVEIGL